MHSRRFYLKSALGLVAGPAVQAAPAPTIAELRPEAIEAFQQYIRQVEAGVAQRAQGKRSFLWADEAPERLQQLKQGEIPIEPLAEGSERKVPDGLIHDWVGSVFVPRATIAQTLALVQNYNQHKAIYSPEVVDSRLLQRNGNRFQVQLRLVKEKVLTVVLNTTHDVDYQKLDENRWISRSYSTRIAEVDNPGKSDERELPVGQDHGFLWRLYSYWRFLERDGGVYVECQAVSLTRNVPLGLGWLINPIVKNLPRESLTRTLSATRSALA